jgi:hypothetical protein
MSWNITGRRRDVEALLADEEWYETLGQILSAMPGRGPVNLKPGRPRDGDREIITTGNIRIIQAKRKAEEEQARKQGLRARWRELRAELQKLTARESSETEDGEK